MKKRAALILALGLATMMLASSTGAQARTDTFTCEGVVQSGKTASCTKTFTLDDTRFISIIGTAADFTSTGAPLGAITMTWRDAAGKIVTELKCTGAGVPGDLRTSLTCTQGNDRPYFYAAGTQTLTVAVTTVDCGGKWDGKVTECGFGGKLRLGTPDELI